MYFQCLYYRIKNQLKMKVRDRKSVIEAKQLLKNLVYDGKRDLLFVGVRFKDFRITKVYTCICVLVCVCVCVCVCACVCVQKII